MKAILSLLTLVLITSLHADNEQSARSTPPGISIERDLSFLAPGRTEKLDLYKPTDRNPNTLSPAVVIIHGGGWVGGDKNREREFVTATTLAKAGYVCISINYETRSGRRWPNNLLDCKNAVRWLRVNAAKLQVDPRHIGVIGGSAGGHLALMVAYTSGHEDLSPTQPYPGVSDHVSACVNMYGISNLETRVVTTAEGVPTKELKGHRLFPETRSDAPAKWKLASPVNHIGNDSPPTLSLHGSKDTTVDRDQSLELHRSLQAAGIDSTLHLVPGANHAWPLRTKSFDLTPKVTAFFDRYLQVP